MFYRQISRRQQTLDSEVEIKINKVKVNRLRPTGSLAQAGVWSRGTPRRILEVLLPSEPYRYPRLPQAAASLSASGGQRSIIKKMNTRR